MSKNRGLSPVAWITIGAIGAYFIWYQFAKGVAGVNGPGLGRSMTSTTMPTAGIYGKIPTIV